MRSVLIKPAISVRGKVVLLGDKSIAHRCVIATSLCQGKTLIQNFPANRDCLATVNTLKKLGIKITKRAESAEGKLTLEVYGKGLYGFKKPKSPIFVGDSGTTLRLILGILAGQGFKTKLVAGRSLSQRPMLRVTGPLRMMGANINAKLNPSTLEEYPPIVIRGGNLKPINYKMPVASAQVKSAILLAGLFAEGKTIVLEPVATRDHTERVLKLFKADIKLKENQVVIKKRGEDLIAPKKIYVPADISSAAFFIILATILPNSGILIKNVSLNPSRSGVIKILKRMGADIRVTSHKSEVTKFEPMGDLMVRSAKLKGAVVKQNEVPSLIDELPILMVTACFASGKTVFEGVGELRVKETDRIESMTSNLKKMGADIEVYKSGALENIIIRGVRELRGARVMSFGDHRTAMSMIVAGLCAVGNTQIDDVTCINKSFPNFLNKLKSLIV